MTANCWEAPSKGPLPFPDNGQDAFQSLWGDNNLANFKLEQSWLYNGRRHPKIDESAKIDLIILEYIPKWDFITGGGKFFYTK